MSGIQGLGSPAANYAASLIASGAQGSDATLPVQPGSSLSANQIEQLQRKLQQAVQQAFQQASQGQSLDNVRQSLRQNVSDTLSKYGFSDADRDSVLGQLDQVFGQGTSQTDVQQQVQQLLQNVIDNLRSGAGNSGVVSASPSDMLGQGLDLMG
ncbi:MAG TPA: hypothetical protein VHC19_16995 [Pirellulales bacterium]|jgi:hypothetical protein|nr:hypothetical protein [Pirellulales bacterium]